MHIQIASLVQSHGLMICCYVEEERCGYQVQSWWRTYGVDYLMLIGWTHWELDACFVEVIMMPWWFLVFRDFGMT